jgi:predicted dehydrogenase
VCAAGRTFVAERPAPEGGGVLPIKVEDTYCWLMNFANGALGVCHTGWSTVGRAPGLEIRVYGSRGAVQVMRSEELPGSELPGDRCSGCGRWGRRQSPARRGVTDPPEPLRHSDVASCLLRLVEFMFASAPRRVRPGGAKRERARQPELPGSDRAPSRGIVRVCPDERPIQPSRSRLATAPGVLQWRICPEGGWNLAGSSH